MTTIIEGPTRPLFQSRPLSSSALLLWSNPFFGQYKIPLITLCNVSASTEATVTLYHDDEGSTYDDDTVVMAPVVLAPGDTVDVERAQFAGYKANGSVGAKVSVPGIVNITGYGVIDDEEVSP